MKKRIFSLLLALALAVCLLPAAALADGEPITAVSVSVTEPAAGAAPAASAGVSPGGCYVEYVEWYHGNGDVMEPGESFAADGDYRVDVFLQPSGGFAFDPGVSATVNGTNATVVVNSSSAGIRVYAYFHVPSAAETPRVTVSEVSIGITPPAAGAQPDLVPQLPAGAGYSVANVSWHDEADTARPTSKVTGPFEAGKTYSVTFFLAPDSGHVFAEAGVKASVNGTPLTYLPVPVEDGGLYVSMRFTLEEAAPKTVIDEVRISVTPPAAGAQPDLLPRVPEGANYSVANITWHDEADTARPTSKVSGAFEAGKVYSVIFFVVPDSGYAFAETGVKASVNGALLSYEPEPMEDGGIYVVMRFDALAAEEAPFGDVPKGIWYERDVRLAYATGLINGKSADSFAPTDNITFAETVKLAACMHQLYTDGAVTLQVGAPAWYDSYVAYAKEQGIIDRDYAWNAQASRAAFVEIFAAALPAEAFPVLNGVADGQIPDVGTHHPQAAAIYLFYRAGILVGYPTAGQAYGEFRPDNSITRAEVAAILTRMMYPAERIGVAAG